LCINIAQEFGLSKDDVNKVLELYHIIGVLVYYKDHPLLKTKVFLNPQWLGKALLACAIETKSDYFITTDKGILNKKNQISEISILNPVDFIIQIGETK
jgi:hypothetical protein